MRLITHDYGISRRSRRAEGRAARETTQEARVASFPGRVGTRLGSTSQIHEIGEVFVMNVSMNYWG